MLGLAICDDGFELAGGRGEVGRCGCVCGLVGAVVSELGWLGVEVIEAGVQVRHALLAALGGEPALLEGLEVALGRAFDACDLGVDRAAAFIEHGALFLHLLLGSAEGVVDERAVAVYAGELAQDGGLELLARDALTLAGFGAVLLAIGSGMSWPSVIRRVGVRCTSGLPWRGVRSRR